LNPDYKILTGIKIYLDFDGVLSGTMMYNQDEKCLKSAQYGARHSLEILSALGAEMHVITGDSSGTGRAITQKIISKMPITEYHTVSNDEKLGYIAEREEELNNVYYIADDIFDCVTAKYIKTLVPRQAFSALMSEAHFTSTQDANQYFIIECTNLIISDILSAIKHSGSNEEVNWSPGYYESDHLTRMLSIFMLTDMYSNKPERYKKLVDGIEEIEMQPQLLTGLTTKNFVEYLTTGKLSRNDNDVAYDSLIIKNFFV